jgi:hypothetical protein
MRALPLSLFVMAVNATVALANDVVILNGGLVVQDGNMILDAAQGQPIRRAVAG